jgi:enoyl-CoA hydratase
LRLQATSCGSYEARPVALINLVAHGAVCELVLDNPPVNALSSKMYEALASHLDTIEQSDYRVVVISARGEKAFSAGADLKEKHAPGSELAMFTRINEVSNRLEALPQITIAAIERAILGGGLELVLACDLRLASSQASFGFPEVGLGDYPGTGGTLRLPWLIGEARARELLLTGTRFTARRALSIGLVSRLVPTGRALDEALRWAEELARFPVSGVRAIKASVVQNRTQDAISGSRTDAIRSSIVNSSAEAVEGRVAFAQRKSGPTMNQPPT